MTTPPSLDASGGNSGAKEGALVPLARLVLAGEAERRRLTAEIHDDSIQAMTAAGMRLQILRGSLDSPEQQLRLDELEQAVQLALARMRHLIVELQPPAFEREGLADALRAYTANLAAESGGVYEVADLPGAEPPAPTQAIAYRLTQDVLREHPGASAALTFALDANGFAGRVALTPADSGNGHARRPSGDGLAAARERAELAGGWLRVSGESEAEIVEYWVPLVELRAERAT